MSDLLKKVDYGRDIVKEHHGDTMLSQEEHDQLMKDLNWGSVNATFVRLDPKTGKLPTLSIFHFEE